MNDQAAYSDDFGAADLTFRPYRGSLLTSWNSDGTSSKLKYAFQPVVNLLSGVCFGYRAFLNGFEDFGFLSVSSFFEEAEDRGELLQLEERLQRLLFVSADRIPHGSQLNLFYAPSELLYAHERTCHEEQGVPSLWADMRQRLQRAGAELGAVYIEIPVTLEEHRASETSRACALCHKHGFKVARSEIDNAYVAMNLLYNAEVDLLKLNHAFLTSYLGDHRNRILSRNMINLAHSLGIAVVAEGVSDQNEYRRCADFGCDLVQGNYIQASSRQMKDLRMTYGTLLPDADSAPVQAAHDNLKLTEELETLEVITLATPLLLVLDLFQQPGQALFLPVVNERRQPVGVIRETDLKEIIYSQYGRDLLSNQTSSSYTLRQFIVKMPIADIDSSTEEILDVFTVGQSRDGLLMVRNGCYIGYMPASSLLKIYHEQQMAQVHNQTADLAQAKEHAESLNRQLSDINQELKEKHELITDSITYASHIQKGIFPREDDVLGHFQEGFIFLQPRDIVSGDFYWFARHEQLIVIAAIDCTGHGVPGALMTVLANDLMNQVVHEQRVTMPDKILHALDEKLTATLRRHEGRRQLSDGMDVSLAVFDLPAKTLYYAGAKNNLYRVREGRLDVVRGSRFTVGGKQLMTTKTFTRHNLPFMPGDTFYIATDGFQDQFGGRLGRKYMVRRFRDFLARIGHIPVDIQGTYLNEEFNQWKGDRPQTDDVLVIGMKVQ